MKEHTWYIHQWLHFSPLASHAYRLHARLHQEFEKGFSRATQLKIKGQPRSCETLMMFMPPRRARYGPLTIGELQGFPKARRVIGESRLSILWSLNESSEDDWGGEGNNRSAQCGRSAP
jgi:hypothetical protein